MWDPNVVLEAAAAAVTAIGGIYGSGRHLILRSKRKREEYRLEILKEAKAEAEKFKISLESRIDKVEAEFKSKQDIVAKDIVHMQNTYNSEIRTLGIRIEELRQDIASQHSSLVALLTKLVDR